SHRSGTVAHTLSLHDALPICPHRRFRSQRRARRSPYRTGSIAVSETHNTKGASTGAGGKLDFGDERRRAPGAGVASAPAPTRIRSEEHTSELQSRENLVCRLL